MTDYITPARRSDEHSDPRHNMQALIETLKTVSAPVRCRECEHIFDVGAVARCTLCGGRYLTLATQAEIEADHRERSAAP